MNTRSALASALTLVAAIVAAQEPSSSAAASGEAYPVVLTPTRLRQSLQEVPASVTIITSDTLRMFGITTVPDALRLVPGMAITQPSGSDFRIGYHGTNILTPRRMNVLVDGVSVYQPAFARVDWDHLPVIVEDIDRIEVIRGPNSAAYGPNSMLAIINIITKHPADVERVFIAATKGTNDRSAFTARIAGSIGATSMRLSVGHTEDGGYDELSLIDADHDSTRYNTLSFRSQTDLDASTRLGTNISYVGGTRQVPLVNDYQLSFPDQHIDDVFASVTLTKTFSARHEFQARASHWRNSVRQTWFTCMPAAFLIPEMFDLWQANPAYANSVLAGIPPTGGSSEDDALAAAASAALLALGPQAASPICGVANQNLRETRSDLELQDTYVFSERLRMVTGIGARYERGESETYLGRAVSNSAWRAFANIEYRALPWLTLNGGAYAERDQLTGSTISPRFGANVRVTPHQVVRFLWSSGSRTPDIQEQRANWSYTFDGSPPLNGQTRLRFFQSARSPGTLSSERIISREIGYLADVPALGLMFDAKVFDDRLSDLISEKLQVSDYQPTNSGTVHLRGLELQASARLGPNWFAFANYAYLSTSAGANDLERTQFSRHSGSIGVSNALPDGWHWSMAGYWASGNGAGETSYGRQDLNLSRSVTAGQAVVTASLTLRRLDNRSSTYFRDVGNAPEARYARRLQGLAQFQIAF